MEKWQLAAVTGSLYPKSIFVHLTVDVKGLQSYCRTAIDWPAAPTKAERIVKTLELSDSRQYLVFPPAATLPRRGSALDDSVHFGAYDACKPVGIVPVSGVKYSGRRSIIKLLPLMRP
jgi:hypothetical protein